MIRELNIGANRSSDRTTPQDEVSQLEEAIVRTAPQKPARDGEDRLNRRAGDTDDLHAENLNAEAKNGSGPAGTHAFGMFPVREPNSNERQPCPDLPPALRDEVLKLVQRVFVFPNSQAPRSLVFCSVDGSGSSEICASTAELLAAQRLGSVCLVSTSVSASFNMNKEFSECQGLMGAMASSDPITSFVLRTKVTDLWLMPVGPDDFAYANFFPADRLRSRMTELKQKFHYVLIDAPPAVSSLTAVVLGRLTDGVILVVEANSTQHETARAVKEALQGANVKLVGAILNNHTVPVKERLFRSI